MDWMKPYLHINNNRGAYNRFEENVYKDWGFDRVEGEDPPDWVQFMTFSSTPDNSDLADVMKLTKEETVAMGHDGPKFIQQCSFDQKYCSER